MEKPGPRVLGQKTCQCPALASSEELGLLEGRDSPRVDQEAGA